MGVLESDFVIFCADTQLNGYDGIKSEVDKVYYINKDIIVATGGDYSLSHQTISLVTAHKNQENISFHEFYNAILQAFNEVSLSYSILPNVTLLVAGKEQEQLLMNLLAIIDAQIIHEQYVYDGEPVRKILGQTHLHFNTLTNLFPKEKMTPATIISKFQELLNKGILVDETINNKMTYVIIRK